MATSPVRGHAERHSECLAVGLVPFPIEGGRSTADFLAKLSKYVDAAANEGTKLLVFPEYFCFDVFDFSDADEIRQVRRIASEMESVVAFLQRRASERSMYIVAGSFPTVDASGRLLNRSFLFAPDGTAVSQDKLFLTPDEEEWGMEGGAGLSVIETPWGNLAILVCYDTEIPLLSQMLSQERIDIIVVPSMTTPAGFTRVRWGAQARAVEHMAYVLVTGTTGKLLGDGWEMKAQPVALGPSLRGHDPLIAEGAVDSAETMYATLDLEKLALAKDEGKFYPSKSQNNVIAACNSFIPKSGVEARSLKLSKIHSGCSTHTWLSPVAV